MQPERDFSDDLEGADASPPPSEYKARLCYRLRHQFPHESEFELPPCLPLLSLTYRGALKRCLPCRAAFLQAGSILIMLLVVYGSLTLAIGAPFRPPGPMWALSVLWVCSHAAAFVASRVGRPMSPRRGPFLALQPIVHAFGPVLVVLHYVMSHCSSAVGSSGIVACIIRSTCAHIRCSDGADCMRLLQIGLPVQVGMLLVGLLLQNVGAVNVSLLAC